MRNRASQSVCAGILFFLLCPATTAAQEEHQHHETGEKIGKVNFVVSCSADSQKQFNRAVAWLHSFEYGESERAFSDIAISDPQCAMARWGAAMSLYHQLWAPPWVRRPISRTRRTNIQSPQARCCPRERCSEIFCSN